MNEIPELLARAQHAPIDVTFASESQARRWVFRAHNHIRRHAPHLRQLMIGRRANVVRIEVPQFTVTEASP